MGSCLDCGLEHDVGEHTLDSSTDTLDNKGGEARPMILGLMLPRLHDTDRRETEVWK